MHGVLESGMDVHVLKNTVVIARMRRGSPCVVLLRIEVEDRVHALDCMDVSVNEKILT